MNSLDFDFLIRLLINMVGIFVLVRLIYFRATKQRAYASSYILFGLSVFLIISQLASKLISPTYNSETEQTLVMMFK